MFESLRRPGRRFIHDAANVALERRREFCFGHCGGCGLQCFICYRVTNDCCGCAHTITIPATVLNCNTRYSGNMNEITELKATVDKLATVNERRSNLIEYRDRQIKAALAAGATWKTVQELTGLSVRGLALAVKRV